MLKTRVIPCLDVKDGRPPSLSRATARTGAEKNNDSANLKTLGNPQC